MATSLSHAMHHAKPTVLSVALWLFGISTSVLLIGMSGRAVTSDWGLIGMLGSSVAAATLSGDRPARLQKPGWVLGHSDWLRGRSFSDAAGLYGISPTPNKDR